MSKKREVFKRWYENLTRAIKDLEHAVAQYGSPKKEGDRVDVLLMKAMKIAGNPPDEIMHMMDVVKIDLMVEAIAGLHSESDRKYLVNNFISMMKHVARKV